MAWHIEDAVVSALPYGLQQVDDVVAELPALQGAQRVLHTGVERAKQQYLPTTWTLGSVLYILLYTAMVFYVTEYLMRGTLTRWLYMGTMAMAVSLIYRGVVSLS